MFRAGVVYAVRDNDHKTLDVIKPFLGKKGPFETLSKKSVTDAVADSAVKIGPVNSSDVSDEAMQTASDGSEKVISELMDGLKAAQTALSDEAAKLEVSQADVATLKAGKLEVEQSLKEKEVALNVALGKVEALQQELDDVIKPAGKGAGAAK